MKQCKITVLHRAFFGNIVEKYSNFGPSHGPCPVFTEGQSFVCGMDMPANFCSWAWDDIHKLVFAALGGVNFNEIVQDCTKNPRQCIACCTDGYRPVTFLIETLDGVPGS